MTKAVLIYSDNPSPALSIDAILKFLAESGIRAEYRGNFFDAPLDGEFEAGDLARRIAGAIIFDVSAPVDVIRDANRAEVAAEAERVRGIRAYSGVFYDALWLQRIFHAEVCRKFPGELQSGALNIILTGRLVGTFDRRYHARVVIGGNPSIVSTSGLVEAPAKPRDYYIAKAAYLRAGLDIADLDRSYRGRFIEYDDARTTDMVKSYLLQAIFYEITGEAFCTDAACALYNSHWQEDALRVQLGGKLCPRHREILSEIRNLL